MKQLIELDVNGEVYELAVEPRRTLLEVLRENLGLTGAKEGCDMGECGTCTAGDAFEKCYVGFGEGQCIEY